MKRLGLSILVLLPLLAGCLGESGPAADAIGMNATDLLSDSGNVLVDVSADAPIALGSNTFVVRAEPASGSKIEAVTVVAATALMPAHGHDVRPQAIEREGDSFRLRDLRFAMSGRWQVTVELDEDGSADTLRFGVEVP